MNTFAWMGYEFTIYGKATLWKEISGVYIFAGLNQHGEWFPLYIGQAESLAARLPTHERWLEAVLLGATHVHVRVVPQAVRRQLIETLLIATYQPRLNTHHR